MTVNAAIRYKRVGHTVNFLYPKHGNRNILRNVSGTIVEKGVGPAGPYVKVEEQGIGKNGGTQHRTFSVSKILPAKS